MKPSVAKKDGNPETGVFLGNNKQNFLRNKL